MILSKAATQLMSSIPVDNDDEGASKEQERAGAAVEERGGERGRDGKKVIAFEEQVDRSGFGARSRTLYRIMSKRSY